MHHQEPHALAVNNLAGFVLLTRTQQWVIPENCELLKMLLEQQNIHPEDLLFPSATQCKGFIQKLFLLAIEDEQKNQRPSPLASFGRQLMQHKNHTESRTPTTYHEIA